MPSGLGGTSQFSEKQTNKQKRSQTPNLSFTHTDTQAHAHTLPYSALGSVLQLGF